MIHELQDDLASRNIADAVEAMRQTGTRVEEAAAEFRQQFAGAERFIEEIGAVFAPTLARMRGER